MSKRRYDGDGAPSISTRHQTHPRSSFRREGSPNKRVQITGAEDEFGNIDLGDDSDEDGASQQLQEDIARVTQKTSASSRYNPLDNRGTLFNDSSKMDREFLVKLIKGSKGRGDEMQEQLDLWMAMSMKKLVQRIENFASQVKPISVPISFYAKLMHDDGVWVKALVRYIGCLAIRGPNGNRSWVELLSDQQCRKALVVAVIGRALKEHVFSHLYFGASKDNVEKLDALEQKLVDRDGFERTKQRWDVSEKFGYDKSEEDAQSRNIADRLCEMLYPFWNEKRHAEFIHRTTDPLFKAQVWAIVQEAMLINFATRSFSDVVYYWPPTFKDEEFEPARMECINLDDMISNSPYDKTMANGGYDRAVLRKGQESRSEAIVRVVCFPGLVAYRQGGGSLAQKQLGAERKRGDNVPPNVRLQRRRMGGGAESYTGDEGFRSRVICKSVVMLQWGKQRLLTKEAGTSAHINAVRDGKLDKYTENSKGYKELYDLYLEYHPLLRKDAEAEAEAED